MGGSFYGSFMDPFLDPPSGDGEGDECGAFGGVGGASGTNGNKKQPRDFRHAAEIAGLGFWEEAFLPKAISERQPIPSSEADHL